MVSRFSLRMESMILHNNIHVVSMQGQISVQHTRRTMGRIRGWTACVPWFFPRYRTVSMGIQSEWDKPDFSIHPYSYTLEYRVQSEGTPYRSRTDSSAPIDRVGIGFPSPLFSLIFPNAVFRLIHAIAVDFNHHHKQKHKINKIK